MNTENLFFIVICTIAFFIFMGVYKVTYEKNVLAKENIRRLLSHQKSSPLSGTLSGGSREAILKKRHKDTDSFIAKLENKLDRANLMVSTTEFLIGCVVVALIAYGMCLFFLEQPPFLAILEGLVIGVLPFPLLSLKIWFRMNKAEEQFSDVLDSLVNCFKTGYAFSRSVQVVAENYEDPWGTEFNKMVAEMNLGATQEEALLSLSNRIPLPDVDLFVTAIMIQKETGGNLSEMLSNLSTTCRERFKLFRKIAAISAQGQLSAVIIICIPFGIMGMMYAFLPEPSVEFITNPIGIAIMSVAILWMFVGIFVLYKIVQIEV